ncbi:MAG: aminopeptidase P family protein [Candidatus Omnitrophica bacterium]|nr:aminopeptidase P family protein [Candidatus Omnitrophota bacterium]
MHDAILMIAASEKDANLYYATRFLAPDPFIYTEIRGKKYLLMSDLELDRAKSQAKVDEVLSASLLAKRLSKAKIKPTTVSMINSLYRDEKVKEVLVPGNFPFVYGEGLRKKGYSLTTKEEPFFEGRLYKTEEEITKITETQRATEAAVEEAIRVISGSRVSNGKLYTNGKVLTSEAIKKVINVKLMEMECVAEHTIVSCGKDGVDPHNQGSGPLLANEAIVLDVFPRSAKHGYFADMTRTVVKGNAKPKLKKMYQLVKEGQEIAFKFLKDGVDGSMVHNQIMKHFEKEGFKTGEMNGRMQGFFHGTGHGVGLEIHEPPRVSPLKQTIRARQVVTVEPGLYYLDAGGVRIEDLVVVTKTGVKNLTKFPKVLEI